MATSETDKILLEFKKLQSSIDKRFDAVDKDLSEIKDTLRKIQKFIPLDNADFNIHVSQSNGAKKPTPKSVTENRKRATV